MGWVKRTKGSLVAWRLLKGLVDALWIGALGVFTYFLYQALTTSTLWPFLGWSFVVSLIGWQVSRAMQRKLVQVNYMLKLAERGYSKQDAEAAWYIATGGGTNLLRNLEQAEPIGDAGDESTDVAQPGEFDR